ncbi:hypothetical protein pkur_cds_769 [Pandoravirus kuranda]|uniref:Uncharacterized protein n=1 Tax=Pandoravirus kuranda TaxID=3019033 RepID=A0AA95EHF5_9VIRU|nr:hypothetical protein pkur_cds_769 [Pandoravirus kuranda]
MESAAYSSGGTGFTGPATATTTDMVVLVPVDAFPPELDVRSWPNRGLVPRAANYVPVLTSACEVSGQGGEQDSALRVLLSRLNERSLVNEIASEQRNGRSIACALLGAYASMWRALDDDPWASTAVKRALVLQRETLENAWPPDVESVVDIYESLVGTPVARLAAYSLIGQATETGVGLARLVSAIGALYRRRTRQWAARMVSAPVAASASIRRALGDWPREADPHCTPSANNTIYALLVESAPAGIAAHLAAVSQDGANAQLVASRDLDEATGVDVGALPLVALPYAAALPDLLSTLVYDTPKDDAITALEDAMVLVPSWADLPPALLNAVSPLSYRYLVDFGAPADVRVVWLDACTLALVLAQHRGAETVARALPLLMATRAHGAAGLESTPGTSPSETVAAAYDEQAQQQQKRPKQARQGGGPARVWPFEEEEDENLFALPRPVLGVPSLAAIAQSAILGAPQARFDLSALPIELAQPLALDLWQHTCGAETAERDGVGRLVGGDRLYDVAAFWSVHPNAAERARPDLLCASLAPAAIGYAAQRLSGKWEPPSIEVRWPPSFGQPDMSEDEREAWKMACDAVADATQGDADTLTPEEAVARAYQEVRYTRPDEPLQMDEDMEAVVDLVARADAYGRQHERAGPALLDKARLALLAVRFGVPVAPSDLATFGGACAALAPAAVLAP